MRQFPPRHAWQVSVQEAIAIQQLRPEVMWEDAFGDFRYVACIDVGFDRRRPRLRAPVVVLQCNPPVSPAGNGAPGPLPGLGQNVAAVCRRLQVSGRLCV